MLPLGVNGAVSPILSLSDTADSSDETLPLWERLCFAGTMLTAG
jgi:hypothetical protein